MRLSTHSVLLLAAAFPLWCQVGLERAPSAGSGTEYPTQWPAGPGPDTVPEWAKPGRIHFARWDGGRIETAKAMLSGWPGFNPPDPNRLETMTNWYRPETVRLLREAGINMIWVTFSNGFSIETERPHQEQVKRYIDECHRSDIHVMAYESIANMFWEDMYQQVPESRNWANLGRDGKPTPYGAGDYTKMGRITRYMADLSKPEWRAYLRRRIDLALDAGADGVIYDNNFSNSLLETYREMYSYGASRKKDFLLMGNFHANTYVYNRVVNCLTTEDGRLPGFHAAANPAQGRRTRDPYGLFPFNGGSLKNNIGLFRIHQALTDGWKPAMIEDNEREVGQRETNPMSAAHHKLALAEGMMLGVAMELFVEGGFAHSLDTGEPEARVIWDAIGRYNHFFADNEQYYVGAKPVSRLAIVLDDRTAGVDVLNAMAARSVIFDVLYEHDLTPEKLAPYSAAALLTTVTVRARALSALERFVARGGKLFVAGNAATLDETGRQRPKPAFFCRTSGKGESVCYEQLPPADELAAALSGATPNLPVKVEAPKGVLYNVASQQRGGSTLVHLLNYTGTPASGIKVAVQGKFSSVKLLSPDSSRAAVRVSSASGSTTEVEVPELGTYSLLVFGK